MDGRGKIEVFPLTDREARDEVDRQLTLIHEE